MPSRYQLQPTLRTTYPNRFRQHPMANRLVPPYAEPGRPACPVPGCITVPHGYNPGPYCTLHTVEEAISDGARSAELERAAKRDAKVRATLT